MTLLVANTPRSPEALLALCDRLAEAGIRVHAIQAAENEQVAFFVALAEATT